MPITSSMTAAPRMVMPSLVRSFFNSSNVWALIETLVAVRMVPTNTASLVGMPTSTPNPQPPRNGRITPPVAEESAGMPTRRMAPRSVSRPAMNMRRITPNSPKSLIVSVVSAACEKMGEPMRLNTLGPMIRPKPISPTTVGWSSNPTR